MESYPNGLKIPYAPTDATDLYPETDGQPMAASDLHREILIWLLQSLESYFASKSEVYVSGDILTYYTEGNPRAVVAPDVLVSFGVGQKKRLTYKVWEEGKAPDFVMEFSSKSTYQTDLTNKVDLYAALGIPEYFLYDAEGIYLPSPLMGFQLMDGAYVPIQENAAGGIHSAVLDLDFHIIADGRLAIYEPRAGRWLQTPVEAAEARAAEEAAARQKAEAEVAELREELERLKARS
ncbi:Uma2 family endonuclease [Candidatus Poribacteria bacterium]|nr:MAG: Uma2 family endonuclease [Candidatus Poribacteria bacterium]